MIVIVQFNVIWQFKNATHFKVTKCKKIIKCQTNTIVKQSVRGGSCGYWINKQFIKRKLKKRAALKKKGVALNQRCRI